VGLVVTSIVDPFYGESSRPPRQSAFTLEHDIAYRCSYGDAEREAAHRALVSWGSRRAR